MAGANIIELNADNWQKEVVQSDIPVLVDFWAPWCGPCRQLGPVVDKLATVFAGRVKVGKVNVDDNQELAAQYQVSGIPLVLVFKGSEKPIEKVVGLTSEANLNKMLTRALEA
jgi:thioredoxin 1